MSVTKFKTLDIRPLIARGEEPFAAIRAAVDKVGAGQGLTIVAQFVPAPLIELLKAEGFQSSLERRADGAWTVNFWRT